tara:strand:+ start:37 stop:573 length:537 start_codon:yes stop_codon:yes gene_type:complete
MPDYQKGKIYKLWSPQGGEDEIYYGSTIDDLRKRKANHKNKNNDCNSKILFEKYDDVRIEVIEEYPCDSKAELVKKEGEYIRNNKCLNKFIPDRKMKEYYQDNKERIQKYVEDNKEKIKEYKKNYYENNKDKWNKYLENKKKFIKQKITCECGCLITKDKLARHQKTPKHIKLMEENK